MGKPTARDITCEVCGHTFIRSAWEENQGYCPNCDQPISKMARESLNLPRIDLPDEELPEPGGDEADESGFEAPDE
jgi:hypothetical protein